MQFDRKFGDATRLSRMRSDMARSEKDRGVLLERLRAPKPVAAQARPTQSSKPRRSARELAPEARSSIPPEIPLIRSSSLETKLFPDRATQHLIEMIRRSAIDQIDRIVFTWPERVRNSLGATIISLFGLHESCSAECWTAAFYSKSNRLKYDCRKIFVEEDDIAKRALTRATVGGHSGSGPNFYFNYLLNKTSSAKVLPTRVGAPIAKPNLYEIMPIFEPSETGYRSPYARHCTNFLADIETKRPLLKSAPNGADCASHIDQSPVGLFMLPKEPEEVAVGVAHTARLRDRTDVVVVDFSRDASWDASHVMVCLRKLKNALSVPDGRPSFVIVTSDPFLAQRCREVMADAARRGPVGKRKEAEPGPRDLSSVELVVSIKKQSVDFTESVDLEVGRDVPAVEAAIKNAGIAEFRQRWSARARELDEIGVADGALAIRKGSAFLAKIAALPIGYAPLMQSIEGAEEERGLNPWLASQYKVSALSADLARSAEASDGHRADVLALRTAVLTQILSLRNLTEVSECIRDHLEQATRKANRTLIVSNSELISEALRDYALSGGFAGVNIDQLRRKVIFSTATDVDVELGKSRQDGAQIDKLIVVQPSIKGIQRLVVAPRLPRKMLIIGDLIALELVKRHLAEVGDLMPELSARAEAIRAAIGDAAGQGTQSLDEEAGLPLSAATFLDFTQDSPDSGDSGPRVLITTSTGYRLRYRSRSDCIVQEDDRVSPFRKVYAGTIGEGDGILIMTGRLQERLDVLLGPVAAGDDTFLRLYRQHVQEKAAALPQPTLRSKAATLLVEMRKVAAHNGIADDRTFGKHAVANVARWLSARVDDGTRQPKAPKHQRAFACFTRALGIDAIVAAQFWDNSIKKTRVENMLAGARETTRAFNFLLNPHQFYHARPECKIALRSLFDEMTRSFDEVVHCQVER